MGRKQTWVALIVATALVGAVSVVPSLTSAATFTFPTGSLSQVTVDGATTNVTSWTVGSAATQQINTEQLFYRIDVGSVKGTVMPFSSLANVSSPNNLSFGELILNDQEAGGSPRFSMQVHYLANPVAVGYSGTLSETITAMRLGATPPLTMSIFQYVDANLTATATNDVVQITSPGNIAIQSDPATLYEESTQSTLPQANGNITVNTAPLGEVLTAPIANPATLFASDLPAFTGASAVDGPQGPTDVAFAYEWQFQLGFGTGSSPNDSAVISLAQSINANNLGAGAAVPEPITPVLGILALAALGGVLLGRRTRQQA